MNNKNTLVLFGALFLSACGGGGGDSTTGSAGSSGACTTTYPTVSRTPDNTCPTVSTNVIPGTAQLIFSDGFESGDLSHSTNGFRWTDTSNTSVSSVRGCASANSLQFRYSAAADCQDSMSEQKFFLGGNYRDVWFEYDLFVPENYYHRSQTGPTNNKGFLYLWANTYNDPRPLVAINFWADGTTGQSIGSVYTRPVDQHSFDFSAPAIASTDVGKWLHIVVHYAYATVANNDGVAQIWKTPAGGSTVQILNKTNGPWYHATGAGFDNGYLLGWANSGFSQETRFYIDNVRVYQDP